MKKKLKSILDKTLKYTINHRIVNDLTVTDDNKTIWKSLAAKGFNPSCIVDVGAARGTWTKEILSVFPRANYFMVDPLPENTNILQALSSAHYNVRYWIGALGSKNGEMEIFFHGDQSSMFASEWKGERRRVPVRTLDSFLADGTISNVDVIKLDVQGAEIEVLSGAAEILKKCRTLQVEVFFRRVYEKAPLAHEVIAFLADKGFRIYDINQTYKRPKDRALMQADIFFVSDNKFFLPEAFGSQRQ